MSDSVLKFYDEMAAEYHLIFADWHKGVQWQAEILDKLIRSQVNGSGLSLLDCSCGIGTQAIGLASRGYLVHATDLSPAAVERARREADTAGVSISFDVCDMRELTKRVDGLFDIVISCDNSLPHLLDDDDLILAVKNVVDKLRGGGLFLASIRDYDRLREERPQATLPRAFDDPQGRRIVFQVWDWAEDGRSYQVRQFILTEVEGAWKTSHFTTHYRALSREELSRILSLAGLSDVRWYLPDESGYYQPIVTARK